MTKVSERSLHGDVLQVVDRSIDTDFLCKLEEGCSVIAGTDNRWGRGVRNGGVEDVQETVVCR